MISIHIDICEFLVNSCFIRHQCYINYLVYKCEISIRLISRVAVEAFVQQTKGIYSHI